MSNWDFLNAHRIREIGPFWSDASYGFNGAFTFNIPGEARRVCCIASDGSFAKERPDLAWQHVSVSFGRASIKTPSWEVMCAVKALFWDDEDTVMQLHPPKSQWISNHPGCLHLWRPMPPNATIPLPPGIAVGIKELGELKV